MTKDSNRLIGDIIEIYNDIIDKKKESTSIKIISDLKYKYYMYRLNKVITKISKRLILTKSNLEELFSYIKAYYDGKYKSIINVAIINTAEETITKSEVFLDTSIYDKEISNIRYSIIINGSKSKIEVFIRKYYKEGLVNTYIKRVDDLYNNDIWNDVAFLYLNKELITILTTFIKDYMGNNTTTK